MEESDDGMVLPPPSLSSCVNLSELVLNMKGSYSCVVEISAAMFATLLEANCPNLFKITLEVEDPRSLFLSKSRVECLNFWKDLDSALTMLSERSMGALGKKFIFLMEVTCVDNAIHRAKKWLPRLLPMFNREGSLHVHHGEKDVCHGHNYDAEDKKACMGRAVLAAYGYESESDEKTEEADTAAGDAGSKENQGGGSAEGRKEGEKDEEADEGNEGGEGENEENE